MVGYGYPPGGGGGAPGANPTTYAAGFQQPGPSPNEQGYNNSYPPASGLTPQYYGSGTGGGGGGGGGGGSSSQDNPGTSWGGGRQQQRAPPRASDVIHHQHLPSSSSNVISNRSGFEGLNAPAPFIQSSLEKLPASQSIRGKASIPLGFVLQPMREGPNIPPVPIVSFGSAKVVRCMRCRTYVNPFVGWEAGGRRWLCNVCGCANDTPAGYFCPLDEHNLRQDRNQRPELSQGCVEFVACGDYMTRPPMAPAFVAIIDVSTSAVNSGLTDTVCQSLRHVIASGQLLQAQGDRTQFGIITYDSAVHFYNIKASIARPQIYVITSLGDMFLPLAEGMLVSLVDCQQTILNLLESLPSYWRNRSSNESCMSVALNAGHALLKSVGGKLLVFVSTFPTLGDHKLTPMSRATKEKGKTNFDDVDFLKPAHDQYYSLAHQFVAAQIACDLFVCPSNMQPMDISTLSQVAECTGGELYYLPGFKSQTSGDKLRQEIIKNLSSKTGWECVVRVRISKGWTISKWFGHHFFRGADLMMVPCISETHTCAVLVECQDSVVVEPLLCLQSAVLYTHSSGERRIRVHTYCLQTTSKLSDIANSINVDVAAHLLMLKSMKAAMAARIADGRLAIQTACSAISSFLLQNYTNNPNPFISPQYAHDPFIALDTHPAIAFVMACMGMLKSAAFRESTEIPPDLRHYHWLRMTSIGTDSSSKFFVPRLYPVHGITADSDVGSPLGTPDGAVMLPSPLRLTHRVMSADGAYLADDGESLYLWIGRTIDSNWLKDSFGVQSLDQLVPEYTELVLGTTGSPGGMKLAGVVETLRRSTSICHFQRLQVLRQGDPLEFKFFYCLLEDRGHSQGVSLLDFWQKYGPRSLGPAGAAPAPSSTHPSLPSSFAEQQQQPTAGPYYYPQQQQGGGGMMNAPPPMLTSLQPSAQHGSSSSSAPQYGGYYQGGGYPQSSYQDHQNAPPPPGAYSQQWQQQHQQQPLSNR